MKQTKIIAGRKDKPTRKMAERLGFGVYNHKPEIPKEWGELPLYISTRDFARITGISTPTITKFIQSGELKASKLAGKYLISKEDFKAFMIAKQYAATDKQQGLA